MTARDVFGIIVRTAGLLLVLSALGSLFAGFAGQPGGAWLLWSFGALGLGAYLLRGAPALMGWSYPGAERTGGRAAARRGSASTGA